MTTYKYKGLSPDGAKLSGVIKAYNEFEAVAQLRETCSVITKIEEVKETQSWNKQIGTKKIKDKELAIICSQFAIILTSGLPIVRCVEMVAAQARTKELQKMLKMWCGVFTRIITRWDTVRDGMRSASRRGQAIKRY